jgi:hypothetical protein
MKIWIFTFDCFIFYRQAHRQKMLLGADRAGSMPYLGLDPAVQPRQSSARSKHFVSIPHPHRDLPCHSHLDVCIKPGICQVPHPMPSAKIVGGPSPVGILS